MSFLILITLLNRICLSRKLLLRFILLPEKSKIKFSTRPLITVAKELLGKILVLPPSQTSQTFLAGKIVEVEAYDGSVDQAAHTFIGRTKRNEIMFRQGGYLYVYFTYGVHFCSNVVTD